MWENLLFMSSVNFYNFTKNILCIEKGVGIITRWSCWRYWLVPLKEYWSSLKAYFIAKKNKEQPQPFGGDTYGGIHTV